MIIDHIGIAVKSINKSIIHWEKVFGYHQKTTVVTNTRQKVNVVFLEKIKSIDIKLIEPIDLSSPIFQFVEKGGGLHHLCFKCSEIEKELIHLKNLGLRVLEKPQPGEAFDNELITFVYGQQGLNIEIIDTDKKSGLIREK